MKGLAFARPFFMLEHFILFLLTIFIYNIKCRILKTFIEGEMCTSEK